MHLVFGLRGRWRLQCLNIGSVGSLGKGLGLEKFFKYYHVFSIVPALNNCIGICRVAGCPPLAFSLFLVPNMFVVF